MLLFGGAYLVLLLLFAIFGPAVRTAALWPPDDPRFDAVYTPVARPFRPTGGEGQPSLT